MYASLHNHTDYSNIRLLDSTNRLSNLIDNAYNKNLTAVAITDHDVLSGHVKAVQYYNKNYKDKDFKLILGNEIYLGREGLNAENYQKGEKFFHTLLLAKDEIGHKQLRQLSTRAWGRSFSKGGMMRTPTYISDLKDIVGENPGHLFTSTACLGSYTGVAFQEHKQESEDKIRNYLETMEDIFGEGYFFIELQPSNQKDQRDYNKFMIEKFWGDYPFIFTTDSHYLNQDDFKIHSAFLKSRQANRETEKFYSSTFIMEYDLIKKFFNYIDEDKIEEMKNNTNKIAAAIEDYDLHKDQVVPTVPVKISDEEETEYKIFVNRLEKILKNNEKEYSYIKNYINTDNEYDFSFINKVIVGFNQIKALEENKVMYYDRLEAELEELWETSKRINQPVSKYFLTMAKMIDIIWEDGDSLVGVSRGSAAGFIVNYALGITQIDPLQQELELPHWRFIHKDRPELPDIDIDTEGNKRTKVFNKVREYFKSIGGDVVNVCTFGTEKSKSALRTAARGLDIDDDIVSYIVSLIPNERGFDWTLNECMYGTEEKKPIKNFQEEMEKNSDLWDVASKIEGLITRIGIHAAGVIALNDHISEYNSMMKTNSGALVSAYNLEDTEYMGGLKYDFLTINGLDKIRATLNLLLEDKEIEWEGSLRETYNKHLLPANLEIKDPEMWEMAYTGEVVDLFQFDTPVGAQAIKSIQPQSVAELSIANSLMRLMKQENASEMPADTYVKYKNNLDLWYSEMKRYGINQDEIEILERYLKPLSGVADSQESIMMMVMDENIAGFSVLESNKLRKAIAKKDKDVLAEIKQKYYEKGRELGTRKVMLDYIWDYQIARQIGYSFSVLHTVGYSLIAVQELNLAYKFPIIYWNTACLSVNAGAINEEDYTELIEEGIIEVSDEADQRKSNKVQYGKIANAIGKFRHELELDIDLPDINVAKFGFTPDADRNTVVFGLKSITRIGDKLIYNIIENRPYKSLDDFIEKMKDKDNKKLISKDRVVILIKAGAFDSLENKPREEILYNYIKKIADQKNKINLNNMKMLIDYDLVPESLDYEKRVYNFTRYLRKNKVNSNYYKVDDVALAFIEEIDFVHHLSNIMYKDEPVQVIKRSVWDSHYEKHMNKVRSWMKENQEELLKSLNEKLFNTEYNKYAKGNKLKWELESLNFYHSGHELEGTYEKMPINITRLDELPEQEVIGHFNIKGKQIPKYRLRHIFGTVLDKDKGKHLVTLSTPEGIINIKVYRNQFSKFDHVHSHFDDDGNKVVEQESFFKKGTFLLVTGVKRGDVFVPKVYKQTKIEAIMKITFENGKVLAESKK